MPPRGEARILVTGGTGFLGRACLTTLAGRGKLIATCRGAPPEGLDHVDWVKTDLTDPASIEALCATHQPTHLLALAWEMGPGYQQSVENFRWIQHSIDLLLAFANHGGTRVTFCGSCMEYDWSGDTVLIEDVTPLKADTDYGAAKAALYTAFSPLLARLGLSGAWARPYFIYGPHENPRRLAADVIISLLEGRDALCGTGTQKRDFLHVSDVADAMSHCLFSDYEGALNIGSGQAIPMADLITEIGRQIARPDLIRLGARPPRPGDPELVEAEITRLQSELGWRPKFTLESGLADTISWWRTALEKENV